MSVRHRELSVLSEIDGRGGGIAALRARIDFRGGLVKAIAATAADLLSVSAIKSKDSIVSLLRRSASARARATSMTLLEACENGEVEETRLLLEAGNAIDQSDPEGWTALMFACDNGHHGTADLLLERGAAVDQASRLGTTALMIACAGGFSDIVGLLLEHGARVGLAQRSGWTALMEACSGGHLAAATLLLERGADAAQATQHGDTALMRACMRGDAPLVKLLCSYGARRDAADRHGTTAIDAARAFARRPEPADNHHHEIAEWLEATRAWVTPLHHLEVLDVTRARALVEAGADVHSRARRATPPATAPSPLDLAKGLEAEGKAAEGTAAALVLGWWRARLLALAMGTHARLGEESPVLRLACAPELIELIVDSWSARGESA